MPLYICKYEDEMRFGIVHSEIKFPFASALTFRYLCHSKIISKNKYL